MPSAIPLLNDTEPVLVDPGPMPWVPMPDGSYVWTMPPRQYVARPKPRCPQYKINALVLQQLEDMPQGQILRLMLNHDQDLSDPRTHTAFWALSKILEDGSFIALRDPSRLEKMKEILALPPEERAKGWHGHWCYEVVIQRAHLHVDGLKDLIRRGLAIIQLIEV